VSNNEEVQLGARWVQGVANEGNLEEFGAINSTAHATGIPHEGDVRNLVKIWR